MEYRALHSNWDLDRHQQTSTERVAGTSLQRKAELDSEMTNKYHMVKSDNLL